MYRTVLLILLLTALGSSREAVAQNKASFDGFKLVDKTGNIRKPDNYRDPFQVLRAYMVRDSKGNQMHFTYASPGAADYYRRNKNFADGTVLVKRRSVKFTSKLRNDASATIYRRKRDAD